jgi:hypothetical protein
MLVPLKILIFLSLTIKTQQKLNILFQQIQSFNQQNGEIRCFSQTVFLDLVFLLCRRSH